MRMTTPAYSTLNDTQLLGKLIGVKQARQLYRGSLTPLFSKKPHERLAVARELVQRFIGEELQTGCVLTQTEAVRKYLQIHFAQQEYESFVILYLNSMNRLITVEELFRGTLSETPVYPREIVKSALRLNAGGVIFAHNHPSGGVAKPSPEDRAITKLLKQALALVDVQVLDHLIVAATSTFSFAERGYL